MLKKLFTCWKSSPKKVKFSSPANPQLHFYTLNIDRTLTNEEITFLLKANIEGHGIRFGIDIPNKAPKSMVGMFKGYYA